MTSNSISEKPVGVIGAGNFGTVIANILALQRRVLLYARNEQAVAHMREAKETEDIRFIITLNQRMTSPISPRSAMSYFL